MKKLGHGVEVRERYVLYAFEDSVSRKLGIYPNHRDLTGTIRLNLCVSRFFDMLQPDQNNMAVFFWYLVIIGAGVRYCTVLYTGKVTFYKVPETHGHI